MTSILQPTIASVAALALLVAAASAAAQDEPQHDRGDSSSRVSVDKHLACDGVGGRLSKCTETVHVSTEREVTVNVKVAPPPNKNCQATMSTRYEQRNTVARVEGTIEIADCAACSGDYTLVVRVRDENGETKSLEFAGSWQRTDDYPVTFTTDYPIGANVDLLNVHSRGLRCTCADAPTAPSSDAAPGADAAPGKE
jgi:hypothetical protein